MVEPSPHVEDALDIFRAAIVGVDPLRLLSARPLDTLLDQPLDSFERVVVVGAGKASIPMAYAVERQVGDRVDGGVVVVPHGYPEKLPKRVHLPKHISVRTAGHPVPDEAGEAAAQEVLARAGECGAGDLLIVLVSGGGSALLSCFAGDISIDDAKTTFKLLLNSGADIHEINTVRKHISRIGGGQLALAAHPASVLTLIISDVVGDEPAVIASGPTVGDPSTFSDAMVIVDAYRLQDRLPATVLEHLKRGMQNPALETPKPDHRAFASSHVHLLGSNRIALEAALEEARRKGYETKIAAEGVTGEARHVAHRHVEELLAVRSKKSVCLLWGGETTVTVTGTGKGGRNQEMALAAGLALEGKKPTVALLCGGSDGIDGPTDAAGAWVTPQTCRTARKNGLKPQAYLGDNDAYNFFKTIGGLVITGPTHTNVMDLHVGIVGTVMEEE